MRGPKLTYTAGIALLIAIIAWCLVGYLFIKVGNDRAAQAALASDLSASASRRDLAAQLHALVLASASDRASLAAAVPSDIPSIVDAITATGQAAHTTVDIGAASELALPSEAPASLHEVQFVVQTSGTFAEVLNAAYLFENFSMPSNLSEIDFEQLPASGKTPSSWRATLRLNVVTTASVSS